MLLGNVLEDPEDCNQTGYFNIYYLQGFIMLTDNLGCGSEQENSHLNFAFVRCYHRIRKSWNDAMTELGFFSFIFELFFSAFSFHAFWAISSDYTHSLWLFLSLFKLSPLPVSISYCMSFREDESFSTTTLIFILLHSLWTEYVWQILILSENTWLSFIILFIFIAQSPAGEGKNEDNLVNNEHRDDILFSCNEE